MFLAVIGLFNVISAIFVESSLESASKLQNQKKLARLEDEEIWANNIVVLLKALDFGLGDNGEDNSSFTPKLVDKLLSTHVPRSVLNHVIAEDKSVVQALHNLDIDQQDHKYLVDILDPDNSGSISVLELVDGLKRLRGNSRRSDVIMVDLMIRSLQERIETVLRCLENGGNSSSSSSEQALTSI